MGWSARVGFGTALVCMSATVHADPLEPADLVGLPITAPDFEPDVLGWGHEPGAVPAFDTPTILFVNFEGAELNSGCGNDSKNNCSLLAPIFGGEILPFPGDDSVRASIVQATRADVEDFGVIVVGERPPDSQDYAMVLVGDSVRGGSEFHGFAGIAPGIDCGNTAPSLTSFALAISNSANTMSTVVHQEAAHTWGLEHVDDVQDNLHPVAGGFTDPKYQDRCNEIVDNTDLDPSSGQCNSVHSQFCDAGNQNSYQEMLLLFGQPVPDLTAPSVVIEAPGEGETVPGDFDLVITLDDDRRPATFDVTILLDGQAGESGKYINATLTFPVNGVSVGAHTVRVEIADESGNEAADEVSFVVSGAGGSGDGGGSASGGVGSGGGGGGIPQEDEGCGCRGPASSGWLLWLVLPLVTRPRS